MSSERNEKFDRHFANQRERDLHPMLVELKDYQMTDAEREAQRRSFAYGNVHLHNPVITREMVDAAAESIPLQ